MLTPEQILARQGKCGGSDVAAILGLIPSWRTPFDVWAEKTGLVHRDPNDESPAQRRGRVLEPSVAAWYAEVTGYHVHKPSMVVASGPADWMVGSYDYLVYPEMASIPFGLECKTSKKDDGWAADGSEATGLAAATIIPPHYATQVLWYLEVSGFDRWDVACFFMFTDDFRRYTIRRDKEQGALLVERVAQWWDRHIIGGERPELDGSAAAQAWVQQAFPKQIDGLRDATQDEAILIGRLRAAEAASKHAKAEEDLLKVQVQEIIGDAEGVKGGFGKVTWKEQAGSKRIDADRLRKDLPDVAEQYTKQDKPSRVLRKAWSKEDDQ